MSMSVVVYANGHTTFVVYYVYGGRCGTLIKVVVYTYTYTHTYVRPYE